MRVHMQSLGDPFGMRQYWLTHEKTSLTIVAVRERNSHKLLVVDDEPEMCNSLKKLLEKNGYQVRVSYSGKEALEKIHQERFDLIICDVVMPEIGGLVFLSRIEPTVPVIMMTAYASIETARKAFRWGVRDYLVKPFKFEELILIIEETLHRSATTLETREKHMFIETKNPRLIKTVELAEKFASTDMPILITGESGAGKEIVADYIVAHSLRKEKPYVKINCAAIPETLLESELFGYERGAFTGAFARKIGKFEEADEGTLFLDEIGDMPLPLQAKLLRFLENYEYTRVGGNTRKLNVRVISATNRNLEKYTENGEFRSDLYHRLNGVKIPVPSLRERMEDIEDLSYFFLNELRNKYHKQISRIHPDVFSLFKKYTWPGNIRELKNCLERSYILCEGRVIEPRHLPDSINPMEIPEDRVQEVSRLESITNQLQDAQAHYLRQMIISTLKTTKGNHSEAAVLLRISRKTLYNWIKKLNIHYEYQ